MTGFALLNSEKSGKQGVLTSPKSKKIAGTHQIPAILKDFKALAASTPSNES
jgi:hypothetical protein